MVSMDLERISSTIENAHTIKRTGRVTHVIGLVIEALGPTASVGELCYIVNDSDEKVAAEVVGFKDKKVLLMALGQMSGVNPGSVVHATGHAFMVPVGRSLLGRVINGLGQPIDGKGPLFQEAECPVNNLPINPLERGRIHEPMQTGIKVIDSMVTCGRGQRMGIFSGSGVGKSVLMGMIAQNASAPVNVIALIGERGREVMEFLDKDLGKEGLKKSVVVVATSDQPALVRIKGAYCATAIAEYFRDQGLDVILMMDSITRFAMAQREVGLSVGEPPTTKGYTPSVFNLLPKLLERSGKNLYGSITALYNVLVESDDMNEPVSDAVRSILDGHIVLSRELAEQGHYPAVDVLNSISRVMIDIVPKGHLDAAIRFKDIISTYRRAQDLINIGAYVKGTNPKIDEAIDCIDDINAFFRQGIGEFVDYDISVATLQKLAKQPKRDDKQD